MLTITLPTHAALFTAEFTGTGDLGSVGAGFFTYDDTAIFGTFVDEVDLLDFSWEVTSGPSTHAPIGPGALGEFSGFQDHPTFTTDISIHVVGMYLPVGNSLTEYLSNGEVFEMTFTGFAGAPVPVPAAVWLFGSGLLGLVGVARKRKA